MAGGTLGSGGGRNAAIVGINITPMVDVMLVLLVILMVSANWIVKKQIKIELPKAATGESSGGKSQGPTTILVHKDGGLFVDDKPVTAAELNARLVALAAKDKEATVIISADKEANHGKVVEVMDAARGAGLRKFAITVDATR